MKTPKILSLMLIIFLIGFSLYLSVYNMESIQAMKESRKSDQERIVSLEKQIQDIQDNYVSTEALQPVLTDFEDYQIEVDEIRNNFNDFNSLWKQLFGYEQNQFMIRDR